MSQAAEIETRPDQIVSIECQRRQLLVDAQDAPAVRARTWHLLPGITADEPLRPVSCLAKPEKRNLYLGRLVADRMGAAPGQVRYRDGNPMNCTRENIRVVPRTPAHQRQRPQPRQPAWLSRQKVGPDRPADEYLIVVRATGSSIGHTSHLMAGGWGAVSHVREHRGERAVFARHADAAGWLGTLAESLRA